MVVVCRLQPVLVLCVLKAQTLTPLSHACGGGIAHCIFHCMGVYIFNTVSIQYWSLLHVSYTGHCCMCHTLVIAACVIHWSLLHVSYTGHCCMCHTLVIAACVIHWSLLHVSYTGHCCMCHTLVIAACVIHWLLLHVSLSCRSYVWPARRTK